QTSARAGNHAETLQETDDNRAANREISDRMSAIRIASHPGSESKDNQSADEPGAADRPEMKEMLFDFLFERESEHGGGQKRHHDLDREPQSGQIAPRQTLKHLPDTARVNAEHG